MDVENRKEKSDGSIPVLCKADGSQTTYLKNLSLRAVCSSNRQFFETMVD